MQNAEDYSWPTYDAAVRQIIEILQPKTVLDIGAGAGKYGRMVREIMPEAALAGLELSKESIERHKLRKVYSEVYELRAIDLIEQWPQAGFGLVIMGDVLEHMRKSEGIDFLNWLTYHALYTVIIVPFALVMMRPVWYEGHNSVWTAADFHWHDNWAEHHIEQQQMFILRGYMESDVTLAQLCERVNEKQHILHDGEALVLAHHNRVEVKLCPGPEPEVVQKLWWRAF